MTTFLENSSNISSPVSAEPSNNQGNNLSMETCWFLVKMQRPAVHYALGNNAVQSSDELSGMIEIKNMAQVKEPIYQGSNYFSGDDGINCTSARIKALRFENGDYYIDTLDGAQYTTNKDCIAYAQQLRQYKDAWAHYLAELCVSLDKPIIELSENVSYFWVGGTEPANIHAEKGMIIDACQILAGMEIGIKADSFVEVDEYCERQQYFEAIETVKNVSEDGKCSYVETENTLFYNIEGISGAISQELQSMGYEFHTPSFEVDEREI